MLAAERPAPTGAATGLDVQWLGRVDYLEAWELQRDLHARVVAGEAPDTLLLLEHPPVYTAGRRTAPADRPAPGGPVPVVDVDRGGSVTWHGPGQLVGYPVLHLPPLSDGGQREGLVDVVGHVRRVEALLIDVCAAVGVTGERVEGRSGVWVRTPGRTDEKVAAIGIRVARGVSMHGFALNADNALAAYSLMVACGLADAGVTTLSLQTGREVTVQEVRSLVTQRASGLMVAGRGTLVG